MWIVAKKDEIGYYEIPYVLFENEIPDGYTLIKKMSMKKAAINLRDDLNAEYLIKNKKLVF